MMTNLFSSFDPATSISYSLNWISILIGIMIIPSMFWKTLNRNQYFIYNIMMNMYTEFKTLNPSIGVSLMMVSLFMFILTNNLMGLLPYIFTSSSHLSFTLSLALPLWMSLMLFGWINKCQDMFAHLIPNNTPTLLMPFMVLIETISNMIRPSSLAVRLMANMIAGHLLMTLLGNNMLNSNLMSMYFIIIVQTMLMMFETAISMIQSYVFSILATLYSSEI